jgi:hypothetical protein
VSLVSHNSTDLYPAVRSILTEFFGLHPVCRHETYPATIFHITFYLPVWVCADLQIGYSSVAGSSCWITKVITISVQVGFVVDRVTLGHTTPPPPINSVCPPQYYSTADVCLRLTQLPQKLYNLKNILLLCLLALVFVTS